MNSETRTCQNCKTDFVIDERDLAFYSNVQVPSPTHCPACRFQRRASWRNEGKLFRNKSAKSGTDTLSLFAPEDGLTIYNESEWYADDWDAITFGCDYDFSRPFFTQFYDFMKTVPLPSRSVITLINSDYSANAGYLKNCYLMFNSNIGEDSAYGNAVDNSRDCFDNSHVNKCERSYEGFWLNNCYQTYFSSQCVDSNGLWLSRDCQGCSDCFGCVNLRNQKYCIFNQQYSKEEYFVALTAMKLNTWSGLKLAEAQAKAFWRTLPHKCSQGLKNVDSTGSYVSQSKNVKDSFLIREGEDLRYCQYLQIPPNKDCYDHTVWGDGNERTYECAVCGEGAYNIKFCVDVYTSVKNIEYSLYCLQGSSDLFACVGLRKKQYCIFNKQYSKEEYFALRDKIIAQMNDMPYVNAEGIVYKYGEFFPPELSFHAYNVTLAQEFFPLTKEEATEKGYRWYEADPREFKITMSAADLPDAIEDVPDTILKEIIECEKCKKAYRIILAELTFLRTEHIPLPRQCVDCRHDKRVAQRLKSALYARTCAKCQAPIVTGYSPSRPEIVYCEQCYQQEVV